MDFDWKSAVSAVAPVLGAALGGPVGGVAAKMVSSVLLGKEDGTDEELSRAMQTAGPEHLIGLKQADNDFKVKMKELGLKERGLVFNDKKNARLAGFKTKSKTPAVLAYVLTGLVACMVYGLMRWHIPEDNMTVVNIVFGAVMTAWVGAMQFFHGATIKDEDR